MASKLRVLSELVVFPTCKAFDSADPKTPVARDEQLLNVVAWEVLTRRRLPGSFCDTVEAKQPEFRSQPEVAIGSLGNGVDSAFAKTFPNLPRSVCILINIQRRIKCEGVLRCSQQNKSEHCPQTTHASSLPPSLQATRGIARRGE
jgi:hypothetical protein